nr:hypothetical protein Iba_chr12fCG10110 [Ipomoea batatas]
MDSCCSFDFHRSRRKSTEKERRSSTVVRQICSVVEGRNLAGHDMLLLVIAIVNYRRNGSQSTRGGEGKSARRTPSPRGQKLRNKLVEAELLADDIRGGCGGRATPSPSPRLFDAAARLSMERMVAVLGLETWLLSRRSLISCLAGKKQDADDGDVNREDERLVFLFAMRNEKPVRGEAGVVHSGLCV